MRHNLGISAFEHTNKVPIGTNSGEIGWDYVPRRAYPMGDVSSAKDLEGAKFNLADFRDRIHVIGNTLDMVRGQIISLFKASTAKGGRGRANRTQEYGFPALSNIFGIYSGQFLLYRSYFFVFSLQT